MGRNSLLDHNWSVPTSHSLQQQNCKILFNNLHIHIAHMHILLIRKNKTKQKSTLYILHICFNVFSVQTQIVLSFCVDFSGFEMAYLITSMIWPLNSFGFFYLGIIPRIIGEFFGGFFLWWKIILYRQIHFFSGSRILKMWILPFKIISHHKKTPLQNFPRKDYIFLSYYLVWNEKTKCISSFIVW